MRTRTHLYHLMAGAAGALSIGCSDMQTAPGVSGSSSASASRTVPLDAFGMASVFPMGRAACSTAEYRQFDFWLGRWDAHRTDNEALSGTDVITSRLDGCAVEESWNDGWRGRSLNSYDASTGKWTQFWVYTGGGALTPLLLEGGFDGAKMAMRYDRTSQTGLFIPFPPFAGLHNRFVDAYEWIPDTETGSVFQLDRRAYDGGPSFLAFLLRYDRVDDVTPIPVAPGGQCITRAQNRQFDFMIGEWDIYAGRGNGNARPQGHASFTTDLGGCLVEEHSTEPNGYRGWSFNSWSLITRQWHRTYVDNGGHRIALSGTATSDGMVMTGTQSSPSGPIEVRVTWRTQLSGQVIQTWEFSRDGGATWPQHRDFTYVKR